MNSRKLTVLTALPTLLAVGEFGSAVIIGLGRDPWGAGFAVLFGGLFLLAHGCCAAGGSPRVPYSPASCACSRSSSTPSWHKHGTLDWMYQSVYAVLSLAGLMGVIVVLAERRRQRVAA